jgi:hypothetical protein
LVSTSGATLNITGVQLEKGSTATSFDYRPYSTELQLAQRYYEKSYNTEVVPGTGTSVSMTSFMSTIGAGTQLWGSSTFFKVTKRATPTISAWAYDGTSGQWHYGVSGSTEAKANISFYGTGMTSFQPYFTSTASGQNTGYGHWAASAEL